MIKFCIFVLVANFAAILGQWFHGGQSNWYCDSLKNDNCSTHHHHYHSDGNSLSHMRCGTDGVTYNSGCELAQAHCLDNTTNQLHRGPCDGGPTLSPQEIVHGSEVILDYQCTILSHSPCTHSLNEKICGTDGKTYEDFCEYEKARCTHRDLHVAKMGDC